MAMDVNAGLVEVYTAGIGWGCWMWFGGGDSHRQTGVIQAIGWGQR